MQQMSGQRPDTQERQSQEDKQLSAKRKRITTIFGLFWLATFAVGIWSVIDSKNSLLKSLFTVFGIIILPILGQIFTFLQVYFVLHPPSRTSTSATITPQPSPAGTDSRPSINRIPPYTNPRVVHQMRNIVKSVCRDLRQSDTTATVLTGITGVGKSTLAALIYQHYCRTKNPLTVMRSWFIAKPTWIEITETLTFTQVAEAMFKYLGKPFPADFASLSSNAKASALIEAMNQTHRRKIVILDQFDAWLEWETGYAKHEDIDAWLKAINSQKCTCRILLTSHTYPEIKPLGTFIDTQACMKECHVKGLEFPKGVELLQRRGVIANKVELYNVVRCCDGHAGALAGLASLLQREPALSLNSSRCTQHWRKTINDRILIRISRQLDNHENDLLLNFSVYRTPVPLEAALKLPGNLISDDIWKALNQLLRRHLFRKAGNDHYQLHPLLVHCRDSLFGGDKQALQLAHDQAAIYYQDSNRTRQDQRQQSQDIDSSIEIGWHFCQARRWQDAYALLETTGIRSNLGRWEDKARLLELYQMLFPLEKWNAQPRQQLNIYNNLYLLYEMLGQSKEAEQWRQLHLALQREIFMAAGRA